MTSITSMRLTGIEWAGCVVRQFVSRHGCVRENWHIPCPDYLAAPKPTQDTLFSVIQKSKYCRKRWVLTQLPELCFPSAFGRTFYASADPFPPKPEQPNPAKKYVPIDAGKYTYLAEGILKVLGLRLEDLQLRKLLGLFEHHVERAAGGGNCRQGSRWLKCRRRGGGDGQESKGVEFHTWSCSWRFNLIDD